MVVGRVSLATIMTFRIQFKISAAGHTGTYFVICPDQGHDMLFVKSPCNIRSKLPIRTVHLPSLNPTSEHPHFLSLFCAALNGLSIAQKIGRSVRKTSPLIMLLTFISMDHGSILISSSVLP